MADEIIDLSAGIQPGDMPCCPLCDNEIFEDDPYFPILAHGSVALAHGFCIADKRDDLGM